jgi:hypothetical protein
LQKKRKEILEKKIEFYKEMVKKLMADKEIQNSLTANKEVKLDQFKIIRDMRTKDQNNKDIRSLL